MATAKHAKLSPSSSDRWMNCAGSVALIGDESSPTNEAAMRGTAAHKLNEHMLQNKERDSAPYKNYIIHVKEAGDEDSIIFKPGTRGSIKPKDGWHAFFVDDDMLYGVQTFIDEVWRICDEIGEGNYVLYTERFLDMTWLHPGCGGTADVTIVEFLGWIHLLDYKNGRIVVEVKGNEQMKNYAVGLLHEHNECEGVHVHLVQPNAPHTDGVIRDEKYTADEVKIAEIQIKEAADATGRPNATFRVGDWCTWCVAKSRCTAFDEAVLEMAKNEFADDDNLDPSQSADVGYDVNDLARRAKFIPMLDQYCREILSRIEAALLGGQKVPGYKVVYTNSHRKWANPIQTTLKVFSDKWGIDESYVIADPSLKSPAQVEKLKIPGKDKAILKEIVASLAFKPEGKPVVAEDDDPREAIDPAADALNEFADTEGLEQEDDFLS